MMLYDLAMVQLARKQTAEADFVQHSIWQNILTAKPGAYLATTAAD